MSGKFFWNMDVVPDGTHVCRGAHSKATKKVIHVYMDETLVAMYRYRTFMWGVNKAQ